MRRRMAEQQPHDREHRVDGNGIIGRQPQVYNTHCQHQPTILITLIFPKKSTTKHKMVTFSLDDDGNAAGPGTMMTGGSAAGRQQHQRQRYRPLQVKIDSLDDYDLQRSFEAMDKHKFGRLRPDDAYKILLGLGYLQANHYTDRDKFTFQQFQNEIRLWNINNDSGIGDSQNLYNHDSNTNDDDDDVDEYEGEIVTLVALLDIVKKVRERKEGWMNSLDCWVVLFQVLILILYISHTILAITYFYFQNSDVLQRNRSENMNYTFDLLDHDNKGYLTAEDIQRLAREVGDTELSAEEAETMAQLTSKSTKSSSSSPHKATTSATTRISSNDFRSLLAPPSP
jgi:hypothetical protein